MFFENVVLILIFLVLFLGVSAVALAITFGNLRYTFKGDLSRKEFDVMMDLIFDDPKSEWDRYSMRGGGYVVEHQHGYEAFKVNGVRAFTPLQKIKFFKRMKKWKFDNDPENKKDKLHKQKINQIIFQRELEAKLTKEE